MIRWFKCAFSHRIETMKTYKDRKKPNDPCTVKNVLSRDLKRILQTTDIIQTAQNSLQRALPQDLGQHCQVLNVSNHYISIATPHATNATLLRFNQHDILYHLNQSMPAQQLQTLRISIQPLRSAVKLPKTQKATPQLSTSVRNEINALAKITKNPLIQRALENLARSRTHTIKQKLPQQEGKE